MSVSSRSSQHFALREALREALVDPLEQVPRLPRSPRRGLAAVEEIVATRLN